MKKDIKPNIPEYFSLFLVLSYILFHNIITVFIGIFLSLYIINKDYIDIVLNSLKIKKTDQEVRPIKESIKLGSENIEVKKIESRLTLVEEIEEYGFIPSIENINNRDVI